MRILRNLWVRWVLTGLGCRPQTRRLGTHQLNDAVRDSSGDDR